MFCPYHPEVSAELEVPGDRRDVAWIGWLHACCHLPVWRCGQGVLHPIEARFCTAHGCRRPARDQVVHEALPSQGAPAAVAQALAHPPSSDGRSTPAVAGNVLAYLTDAGAVVAVDFGRRSDAQEPLVLMSGVRAASLQVRRGLVVGAILTHTGFRYVGYDIRQLRDTLRRGLSAPEPLAVDERWVHLRTLPEGRARVSHGRGALRLVVEHDPVQGKAARIYRGLVGEDPGPFLVRRSAGTRDAQRFVAHRPLRLLQVPVPVPGGTFLLGRVRWCGAVSRGAVLLPTLGESARG
ncbi:MAG: hypothetical protein KTR31_07020 [Myxococcales bacterium]|nr:hypothetical protein [Myxococcales bacterium]